MAQSSDQSLEQARLLCEAGAYTEAATLLAQALELDPGNPELEHPLAYCYFWADEPERAIEIAGRMLEDHGGDEQMLLLLVQAHQAAGRPELALRVLDHALESGHDSAAFYAERARILYGRQDYDQALQEARQAIALLDAPDSDPDPGYDHEDDEPDPEDEAEAFWQEHLRPSLGLESHPHELIPDGQASSSSSQDRYNQGIRWMALAVSINAMLELGRAEEALPEAQAMVSLFPQDETAMQLRGRAELATGQRQQARASFSRALQLDPTDAAAQAGLLETIARSNPLYRFMLRLQRTMARLRLSGFQLWLVSYIVFRLVLYATRSGFLPRLVGISAIGLMLTFMIGTWYVAPLTQTTLLADPFGRYMLRRRGKLVGVLAPVLLVAGLALGAFGITHYNTGTGLDEMLMGGGLVLATIPICHAILHGPGKGAWWRIMLAAIAGLGWLSLALVIALHQFADLSERTQALLVSLMLVPPVIFMWIEPLAARRGR